MEAVWGPPPKKARLVPASLWCLAAFLSLEGQSGIRFPHGRTPHTPGRSRLALDCFDLVGNRPLQCDSNCLYYAGAGHASCLAPIVYNPAACAVALGASNSDCATSGPPFSPNSLETYFHLGCSSCCLRRSRFDNRSLDRRTGRADESVGSIGRAWRLRASFSEQVV